MTTETKILTGQARVDAAKAKHNEIDNALYAIHNKLTSVRINALNTQHKLLDSSWDLDEYRIVDTMGVPYPADERAELEAEVAKLTTRLADQLATSRTHLETQLKLRMAFESASEELNRANLEELGIVKTDD